MRGGSIDARLDVNLAPEAGEATHEHPSIWSNGNGWRRGAAVADRIAQSEPRRCRFAQASFGAASKTTRSDESGLVFATTRLSLFLLRKLPQLTTCRDRYLDRSWQKMAENVSNLKNRNLLSLCSSKRWKIGLAEPLTYSRGTSRPDKPDKFWRDVAKNSLDPMP